MAGEAIEAKGRKERSLFLKRLLVVLTYVPSSSVMSGMAIGCILTIGAALLLSLEALWFAARTVQRRRKK